MNLISCKSCGIVLNTEHIANTIINNDGDPPNDAYGNYVTTFICPCCHQQISFRTNEIKFF